MSRHVPDICDDLKGKYPKDFKFTGWHPWCRCYAVPILPSVEDFASFDMDAEHHEGEVADVPRNFKKWVGKNEGRIAKAKKLPNFLKDNEGYWKTSKATEESRLERNRKEYERLKADQSYKDVKFDEKTGGVKATHVGHNFDRHKGWYETTVQEVGYKAGHSVILEKEPQNEFKKRSTEGLWDGQKFEIAGAETATPNNIRNALKHCASKPNTEIAVLLFPNDNFSAEKFEEGFAKFSGLKKTSQYKKFKLIYCISKQGIMQTKKPSD